MSTQTMEVQVEAPVLLLPQRLVPYFRVAEAFGDSLRMQRGQYALPLPRHLQPPTERTWQWLLDVLEIHEIVHRQLREPKADTKVLKKMGAIHMAGLRDAGPGELAALLALCDFYDVQVVMPTLIGALSQRIRRVLFEKERPDATDYLSQVLVRETAWREGIMQWLTQRLRSLNLVTEVAGRMARLGPLVACGEFHTLIVAHDGVWGSGSRLSLGLLRDDSLLPNYRARFTRLETPANVVQVACGSRHSCAVTGDGTLWVCGNNANGQLGLVDKETRPIWTPGVWEGTVRQVVCGRKHTLVVLQDGTLWGCGQNKYGQLGLGDPLKRAVKRFHRIEIPDDQRITWAACGMYHSAAVTSTGLLYMFGSNGRGQLGLGDRIGRPVPTQVTGLPHPVHRVATGYEHTIVTFRDAYGAWSWGDNRYSQIRNRQTEGDGPFLDPGEMSLADGAIGLVSQLSCGANHTLMTFRYHGQKQGINVVAFGENRHGQSMPTKDLGTNMVMYTVCAGFDSSFLLSNEGIWASGDNADGQLGLGELGDVKRPLRISVPLLPPREKREAAEELQDDRVKQKRRLGMLCVGCNKEWCATEPMLGRYKFCGTGCYQAFFAPFV